jgi:hypothetical protein
MPTIFATSNVIDNIQATIAGQRLEVVLEMAHPTYTDQTPSGVRVRNGKTSEYVVIRRNNRELRFGAEEARLILGMLTKISARLGSSTPA